MQQVELGVSLENKGISINLEHYDFCKQLLIFIYLTFLFYLKYKILDMY